MLGLTVSSKLPTIVPMRRMLLRWPVLIILVAMFGGHVTELFDRWDNTLQTGRDIDYSIVIVAACVGVVFAAAKGLIGLLRRSPKQEDSPVQPSFLFVQIVFPEVAAAGPSPPSLSSLRV